MAEFDLLDLLSGDHQNLLEAGDDVVVIDLAQHLSVERDLLYPAIEEYCVDAEQTLGRLRADERRLEELMSGFEKGGTPEGQAALHQALRGHIAAQDELFPELRRSIPGWKLVEALDVVPWAIGGSATHGHPRLADGGPMGELVEDVVSMADRLRHRPHPGT